MASPAFNGSANVAHLSGTVELEFSFKIPAGDGAVAVVRDGRGRQVASATGTSGVYTVTFRSASPGVRLPRQVTTAFAHLTQPAATTTFNQVHVVTDSYSASAGTVQLVFTEYADGAASIVRPVVDSWVSVLIKGPVNDDHKDAA